MKELDINGSLGLEPQSKKKVTRLDHVALNVNNVNDSASWYIENLGADVIYADDTWAMLQVGDSKIALTVASQHPPHLGFVVEKLSDIPCNDPAYHRDGSAYLYMTDPDGNTIEFLYYPQAS
ncbi:MAG TPA: VOC family protein [Nitrospinaceae bacterium]|jgi:catechol-2,3-dioxygenase|nr:VOC family protein [Nitrospinaceae bacterium]